MKQSTIMFMSEGDAWLARNRERLGKRDPVSDLMTEMKIAPHALLEIGCSNGWRLFKMRELHHCIVRGIDPGKKAVDEAVTRGLDVEQGNAASLPYKSRSFDTVVFGFCLYLTDPEDWFRIVAEADRVLEENGVLIIHDFLADGWWRGVPYEHCDGVTSWHYDFAQLWLAHPLYTLMRRQVHDTDCITIMRKKGLP